MILHANKKSNISKHDIFRARSTLDIYEHYIGRTLNIPCTIKSPLRKEGIASFCIFGKDKNNLWWQDKATGQKGDVIKFVMELYNISYNEALETIYYDLKVYNNVIQQGRDIVVQRVPLQIEIFKRNGQAIYNKEDIIYWQKRGIEDVPKRLRRNRTFSTEFVYRAGSLMWQYAVDNPIYTYAYLWDNQWYYKSYRPYALKSEKFYNDMLGVSEYCIHGMWYLPESGDNLIISKSGKDNIVLDEMGLTAISVQSENNFIHSKLLLPLFDKWKNIYLLFDNDWNKEVNRGQEFSKKIIDKYNNIKNIMIPSEYKCTDVDELAVKIGINNAKNVIKQLL